MTSWGCSSLVVASLVCHSIGIVKDSTVGSLVPSSKSPKKLKKDGGDRQTDYQSNDKLGMLSLLASLVSYSFGDRNEKKK